MVKFKKILWLSFGAFCLVLSVFFYWDEDGKLWWGTALAISTLCLIRASFIQKATPKVVQSLLQKTSDDTVTEKGIRDIFDDEIVRKKKTNNYKNYVRVFSVVSILLILGVYPRLESKPWQEWLTFINLLALAITWLVYGSSKRK